MIRFLEAFKHLSYRPVLLPVLCLLVMIISTPVLSQTCVPVVDNDIDVNGIVVGTAVLGGGGLPVGCFTDPGWAGVISHNFNLISGSPGTQSASLFMAGFNAANDATLDKLYIGVHIEDDPDFDLDDRLILYFDADNSGVFDAADFALVYEVGPVAPPSNENCNQNPGTGSPTFYRFNVGVWTSQPLPAGIDHKISFDYDNLNDAEEGIWELEIGLDLSVLGLSVASSGAGLKVGARLFVEEQGAGSIPWCWPAGLTTESSPLLWDPNEGNVTPGDLEEITFDDCADVIFEPDGSSGISVTDANGGNNKFTLYEDSDFTGGNLDANKRNNFTADIRFYNPSNPGDTTAVAVPNTGNVLFSIKPWNGGFLGEYLINTSQVEFTQLNQVKVVQFDWPETKAQYDVPKADLDASSNEHVCLQVELEGFNVNMHESSDIHNRNLTYTTLSTIRDRFLISTKGMKAPPGKTIRYIFRVDAVNLPQSFMHPNLKRSARMAKNTKGRASTHFPGNDTKDQPAEDKPVQVFDDWNVTFPNAREIGIKQLKNGYFMLPMKVGQEQFIDIEITGGKMPVNSDEYLLSPKAGGTLLPNPSGVAPLKISVQPGKMVTILASGLINVNPTTQKVKDNGANGFLHKAAKGKQFLLPADYYEPSENIGAVIASFDNFKTAFVIGADASFIVPKDVFSVSLAINDIDGQYDRNTGRGFTLNVIITEPQFLPTRLATPGHINLGIPARPQVGSNLPQIRINAYQLIPVEGPNGKKANILKPTGYVTYAIYKTHSRETIHSNNGKKKRPFELTLPFVFGTLFHDALRLEDGLFTGTKLGYWLAPRFVLELEGGVGLTKDRIKDKGHWLQLMANIRFHFKPLRVRCLSPYLTAGAGYISFWGLTVNGDAFAIQGGVGAMLPLFPSFGLRFDGRILRLGSLFGISATTNFQVGGGLVFWF
jgi:hypothetical protein